MSENRDNYWADDEDDDETSTPVFESDSDLVKRLRKQLKAEQRRNKELETSYGELTKAQKERILKDVLTSKGVNQKIAQFIPNDIEASEDAINAWLDANGEVFGYTPTPKPAVTATAPVTLLELGVVDWNVVGFATVPPENVVPTVAI